MDTLQQVWHGVNLLLLPFGVAAIHAGVCKLFWRQALAAVRWWRLSAWCGAAALAAHLAGWAWTGRDGAMLTYGVMLIALALTTWVVGFAPWRRHTG